MPAVLPIRPIRGARVVRVAALAASLAMVALVAVIGATMNSPHLAAGVRTQISNWTGRDAGFEGGLRISLWPRITVVANGFWIADRAGVVSTRMLTARHAEFHVAWSSLLPWREVVVESIDIDGVDMRVEVLDDGRSNWHFEASAAPDRPAGASAPTDAGAAASVRFDRIRLGELRLTWVGGHDVPAQTFALHELLLVRAQDRIAVTADFALRKQRWHIQADTDRLEALTARLRPWTFDVQARGPGANFALRGALPPAGTSSPLAVTISADLADSHALDPWVAGAAGRLLVPASVLAQIERRGDEWRITDLRASAAGADFDFKGGLVLAAHERPRLDGALHVTMLDFALTPAALIAPGATPSIATQEALVFGLAHWPLDGVLDIAIDRLALPRALTLHNARAQLRLSATRLELTQVSARVDNEAMLDGAARLDIEARGDPAFTLQLNAHALPLKNLADMLIAQPGLVRSGHADLSATLSGQGRSVATLLASLAGDATVTLPEVTLAGAGNVWRGEHLDARLTLAPATQSPQRGARVQGKVRLAALALEHEQHVATTPASSSTTRPTLPRWPAEAALDVTLDRLMLPRLPAVQGLTARVEFTPRHLAVARAKARFAAARVDAAGRVELSEGAEPVYALTLRAPSVSLARLAEASGQRGALRGGLVSIDAALRSGGTSSRAIRSRLSGDVALRFANVPLDGRSRLWRSDIVLDLLGRLAPASSGKGSDLVQCAVVRLPLRDGRAAIAQSIALETRQLDVVANGAIDLRDETLDLAFRPTAKRGLGLNPATLAQFVRMKGPIASPNFQLDVAGTARGTLSIGAAVATGGLSLLGERLLNRAVAPRPCAAALQRNSG